MQLFADYNSVGITGVCGTVVAESHIAELDSRRAVSGGGNAAVHQGGRNGPGSDPRAFLSFAFPLNAIFAKAA